MYYVNQAALENISNFAPVSACMYYCMNMHLVRFGNYIICHFLWATILVKLCKFYTSISQGNKKFHQVDWIKCIMEILWSLGKITESDMHTCKLTEISRNVLFQSHSQALNSWQLKVKISMYKSDFILGSEISWMAPAHLS